MRMTASVSARCVLRGPWGIDLPPLADCMMLHVVTAGSCRIEVPGQQPRVLREGSVSLVPHGAGHRMRSAPEVACVPLFDLPIQRITERYETLELGEEGSDDETHVVCVVVRCEQLTAERLASQLPALLLVESWRQGDGDAEWMHQTLRFLAHEARSSRPGGETIITRLADILIVQVIRAWLAGEAAGEASGWLAALRDDQIGRSLAAIHGTPERPWTLETLAREASMSRSSFASRFVELVGETPLRYLAHWRLQVARQRLRDGDESVAEVARAVGYGSEPAFGRAYKRAFGISPGRDRKAPEP